MSTPPALPVVGEFVDERYRIVALLGQGGMGAVYVAEQVALRREVALKVLQQGLAYDDSSARRFEREARAASRIRHPNVVEVYDFGRLSSGCFYYVMERLEGEDLSRLLAREGRLAWPRTQRLLLQIVRALAAAHEQGIVHRDIKPSNCFIVTPRRRSEPDVIKLLDFGIAKTRPGAEETAALTGANDVVGTALYMAPEQAMGQPVDARTDVYALGVVMFQMLTGRVPFSAPTGVQVLVLHTRQPPPPPRTIEPSIAPAVEGIVLRALAKDPTARFQSMEELEAALDALGPHGEPRELGPAATMPLEKVPRSEGTELFEPIAASGSSTTSAITSGLGSTSSQSTPKTEVLAASPSTSTTSATLVASTGSGSSPGPIVDERASTYTHSHCASFYPPPSPATISPRPWPRVAVALVVVSAGVGVSYGLVLARSHHVELGASQDTPHAADASRSVGPSAEAYESEREPALNGGIDVSIHVDAEEARPTKAPGPKTAAQRLTELASEGVLPPRAWLEAPGSFVGEVTTQGSDVEPIVGARVCAWALDPEAPSELRRIPTCARSDRRGQYVLKGLVPNYYGLTASAEGFVPAHHTEDVLVLAPGESRTGLGLAMKRGGSRLEGHVRDHAGKALRGASVRVGTESHPIAQTVTDERGAFAVWVDDGRYRVGASAGHHGPAVIDGASPQAPVEIVLMRESIWVGRILWQDDDGPVSDVRVRVNDELAYSDRDGRVRLGGLGPGRHEARLDVPGATEHVTTSLALDPGRTLKATIRLPRSIVAPPVPEPEPEPASDPSTDAMASDAGEPDARKLAGAARDRKDDERRRRNEATRRKAAARLQDCLRKRDTDGSIVIARTAVNDTGKLREVDVRVTGNAKQDPEVERCATAIAEVLTLIPGDRDFVVFKRLEVKREAK